MPEDQAALLRKSEELYHRYVELLEPDHRGEYVAIFEDGRVVIGSTLVDVMEKAEQALPPGSYLYRVGDLAIDALR